MADQVPESSHVRWHACSACKGAVPCTSVHALFGQADIGIRLGAHPQPWETPTGPCKTH